MSVPSEYDVVRESLVRDEDAIQLSLTDMPLLATRELVRYWLVTDADLMQLCAKFLDDYTSSKNDALRHWVFEPYATNIKYPGTWRCVQVRMNLPGEPQGVYQVLREGWATTLSESEARHLDITGTISTNTQQLVRYWRNLDPTLIESLANGIQTTQTVTDPKVFNATFYGTFAQSNVKGQIMDQDGAGQVSQVLTKLALVSGATSSAIAAELAAMKYLNTEYNEELKQSGADVGEEDRRTLVFSNLSPDATTNGKLMTTLADAELISTFASGYLYATRQFQKQQDNTAQFTVNFWKIEKYAIAQSVSANIASELNTSVKHYETSANEVLKESGSDVGEEDRKSYVFYDLDPGSTTEGRVMTTLTDADLVSTFASGYGYATRRFEKMENGTARFYVTFWKIAAHTISATTSANIAAELLASVKYFDDTANEVLKENGADVGEEDRKSIVFYNILDIDANETKLMTTLTDADLVSTFATGYGYATRRWQKQDNNTIRFYVTFWKIAKHTISASTSPGIAAELLASVKYFNDESNEVIKSNGADIGEEDRKAFVFYNLDATEANRAKVMDTASDSDLVSTFASGYLYSTRRWQKQDNGTARFYLTFWKIAKHTISASTSADIATELLASVKYFKTTDESVLNLLGFEEGTQNDIAYVFINLDGTETNRTKCMETLAAAQIVTAFGSGYSYSTRKFRKEENGTATFIVSLRKATWTKTASDVRMVATERTEDAGAVSAYTYRDETYAVEGVPKANAASILAALAVTTNATTHAVNGVALVDKGNGEVGFRQDRTYFGTKTTPHKVRSQPETDDQEESDTFVWLRLSKADAELVRSEAMSTYADMTAFTYATCRTDHVLKYVSIDRATTGGSFNVTVVTKKPKAADDSTNDFYTGLVSGGTWNFAKVWIEKVYKNPNPGVLAACNNYYWRKVTDSITAKIRISDMTEQVQNGNAGSFSEYRGNGTFYAEIVSRDYGAWNVDGNPK